MKSLAGTEREYTEIQGRIRDNVLHIQGAGPETNRSYGVAVDVEVPQEFADWLNGQEHTLDSLAGTDAKYVPMQVAVRENDVHIQVAGTVHNRPYVAAFNVSGESTLALSEFLPGGPDYSDFKEEDGETPSGVAIF